MPVHRKAACLFLAIVAAGMATLTPLPATAGKDDPQRLLNYASSKPIVRRLGISKLMTDARLARYCGENSAVSAKLIGTQWNADEIIFPQGVEHPTKGIFRISVEVSDCFGPRIYNTFFLAHPGAAPRYIDGAPGTSRTDLLLQRDLAPHLLLQARQRLPEKCDSGNLQVFDSRVTAEPRQKTADDGMVETTWSEAWTVSTCGYRVPLTIDFVQSTKKPGTTFTVHQDKGGSVTHDGVPLPDASKAEEVKQMIDDLERQSPDEKARRLNLITDYAVANSTDAQLVLAKLYGHPKNPAKSGVDAAYWALRAAYNGDGEAMLLLGVWHLNAFYFDRDVEVAASWLMRAARNGQEKIATGILDKLVASGQIKAGQKAIED